MQITLHDRAPLEKVRRLADGRIAAVAKFARTGCQTYAGAEIGRPDMATVTVYRPESEVFSEDAMASFAHKAITLGHPTDGAVTATNWRKTAVGFTEGRVARDGGFVEIPLMLADAEAVAAYDRGVRELSAGYKCELIWGDGIAPDGTRYQATQKAIRGNHIALVPQGRAGSDARIGDSNMHAQETAEQNAKQMRDAALAARYGQPAPLASPAVRPQASTYTADDAAGQRQVLKELAAARYR